MVCLQHPIELRQAKSEKNFNSPRLAARLALPKKCATLVENVYHGLGTAVATAPLYATSMLGSTRRFKTIRPIDNAVTRDFKKSAGAAKRHCVPAPGPRPV